MPEGGYKVLTGELQAHAGKVKGLADRLRTAADAARQVTMNDSAYGVICQPFAMLLQPFEQKGVNALTSAVETVSESAGTVTDAARSYDSMETAQSSKFKATEI